MRIIAIFDVQTEMDEKLTAKDKADHEFAGMSPQHQKNVLEHDLFKIGSSFGQQLCSGCHNMVRFKVTSLHHMSAIAISPDGTEGNTRSLTANEMDPISQKIIDMIESEIGKTADVGDGIIRRDLGLRAVHVTGEDAERIREKTREKIREKMIEVAKKNPNYGSLVAIAKEVSQTAISAEEFVDAVNKRAREEGIDEPETDRDHPDYEFRRRLLIGVVETLPQLTARFATNKAKRSAPEDQQ